MANFEIKWEAPEFQYHEKEVSWYWVSIIIAALMIAFAAWEKNFLFGFFIVIAEVLFIIWGNKIPHMMTFTITDEEIDIDGHKTYSLKEFESWSVDGHGDEWADILFYYRSRLRTPLVLIVPEEKIGEIRKNITPILKEIEHDPTLIDSIEKFLRF
jgi:hypothetical protein